VKKLQQSRLIEKELGQASIEFALTITLTLLLIFALIDFGRAMYTASVLQWAAHAGARLAIIDDSMRAADVEAKLEERLVGLDLDAFVVVEPLSWSDNVVQVEVSYTFEFVAPIVAQITGDTIDMSASASMIAH
jgi:hypothetical protein